MAKIWYLGHSCFRLEIDGVSIITDPFITPNPLASHIKFEDLTADIILVSHGHADHIADLLALANQTGAEVISNYEVITRMEGKGLKNTRPMNHGGTYESHGISFKMTNAVHSSSFMDGSYAGHPAGFVISGKTDCIYFAGDTALTYDMKLIKDEFDLTGALLPIGDNFTMGAKDAAIAATFCGANRVIGMHYDTFGFIEIDKEEAVAHFNNKGVDLLLPKIGDTLTF